MRHKCEGGLVVMEVPKEGGVKNMRTGSLFSLDFWTLALDRIPVETFLDLTENVLERHNCLCIV